MDDYECFLCRDWGAIEKHSDHIQRLYQLLSHVDEEAV